MTWALGLALIAMLCSHSFAGAPTEPDEKDKTAPPPLRGTTLAADVILSFLFDPVPRYSGVLRLLQEHRHLPYGGPPADLLDEFRWSSQYGPDSGTAGGNRFFDEQQLAAAAIRSRIQAQIASRSASDWSAAAYSPLEDLRARVAAYETGPNQRRNYSPDRARQVVDTQNRAVIANYDQKVAEDQDFAKQVNGRAYRLTEQEDPLASGKATERRSYDRVFAAWFLEQVADVKARQHRVELEQFSLYTAENPDLRFYLSPEESTLPYLSDDALPQDAIGPLTPQEVKELQVSGKHFTRPGGASRYHLYLNYPPVWRGQKKTVSTVSPGAYGLVIDNGAGVISLTAELEALRNPNRALALRSLLTMDGITDNEFALLKDVRLWGTLSPSQIQEKLALTHATVREKQLPRATWSFGLNNIILQRQLAEPGYVEGREQLSRRFGAPRAPLLSTSAQGYASRLMRLMASPTTFGNDAEAWKSAIHSLSKFLIPAALIGTGYHLLADKLPHTGFSLPPEIAFPVTAVGLGALAYARLKAGPQELNFQVSRAKGGTRIKYLEIPEVADAKHDSSRVIEVNRSASAEDTLISTKTPFVPEGDLVPIARPLGHALRSLTVMRGSNTLREGEDYAVIHDPSRDSYVIRLTSPTIEDIHYIAGVTPKAETPRKNSDGPLPVVSEEAIRNLIAEMRREGMTKVADEIEKKTDLGKITDLRDVLAAFARTSTYALTGDSGTREILLESLKPYATLVDEAGGVHAQCSGCNALGAASSHKLLDPTAGIEIEVRSGMPVGLTGQARGAGHVKTYYYQGGKLLATLDFTASRTKLEEWVRIFFGLQKRQTDNPYVASRRTPPDPRSPLPEEPPRNASKHDFATWLKQYGEEQAKQAEATAGKLQAYLKRHNVRIPTHDDPVLRALGLSSILVDLLRGEKSLSELQARLEKVSGQSLTTSERPEELLASLQTALASESQRIAKMYEHMARGETDAKKVRHYGTPRLAATAPGANPLMGVLRPVLESASSAQKVFADCAASFDALGKNN